MSPNAPRPPRLPLRAQIRAAAADAGRLLAEKAPPSMPRSWRGNSSGAPRGSAACGGSGSRRRPTRRVRRAEGAGQGSGGRAGGEGGWARWWREEASMPRAVVRRALCPLYSGWCHTRPSPQLCAPLGPTAPSPQHTALCPTGPHCAFPSAQSFVRQRGTIRVPLPHCSRHRDPSCVPLPHSPCPTAPASSLFRSLSVVLRALLSVETPGHIPQLQVSVLVCTTGMHATVRII
eukprot:56953-Chlamydomonas_euryale.AAC.7